MFSNEVGGGGVLFAFCLDSLDILEREGSLQLSFVTPSKSREPREVATISFVGMSVSAAACLILFWLPALQSRLLGKGGSGKE